jgi:NADH dehydrogenase
VPYEELARRYGFEHHREALGNEGGFDERDLRTWHEARAVPLADSALVYDYLVIATGARPRLRAGARGSFDQMQLREPEGRDVVAEILLDGGTAATVVGGGASGVQYAFELAGVLRRRAPGTELRLVDADDRLLRALPASAHDYVTAQLHAAGVSYLPRTSCIGQDATSLRVRSLDEDQERTLPSTLTLLFGGVQAHPFALQANRYGQVVLAGETCARIFAAGDCARYAARGLDAMTAQAAVRKGKHVAANITRMQRGRPLVAYTFQELGYIVSLGRFDSAGWFLVRENVVRGVAATALRGLVEAQYDLFVDGIDTYVV